MENNHLTGSIDKGTYIFGNWLFNLNQSRIHIADQSTFM